MPRFSPVLLTSAFLCLFSFLSVSTWVVVAKGGPGSVNYTTSTRTIDHDTVVDLPPTGVGAAQTYLSTLMGSYSSSAPVGFSTDTALRDPVVQKAVVQAQQQVLHSGGTLFADATTGQTGGNPVYAGSVVTAVNVSESTTMYIGPQTILVGDNQSISLTLMPGAVDFDTLYTSDVYQNLVYQLMGTTLISDLPGLALIGTNAAGQYVVLDTLSVYSISQSALPVALYQRAALLGVVSTVTGDVNGRLFRLHSGAMDPDTPTEDTHRWEWFGGGNFGDLSLDASGGTPGFDSRTYAGLMGGEYTLSPQLKIGFAGGGVDNYSNLESLGHIDITGWEISAYGTWKAGPFYLDGLYGLGLYADNIQRNTLLGSTAAADPDAITHTLSLNTGYNFDLGDRLVTGPILGLQYTHGQLDGYTETGGGTANVSVASQTFNSLVSDVGWQLSYGVPVEAGKLTFQGRTSWHRENLSDDDGVLVGLVQSPFLLVNSDGGFTRMGNFATSATPNSAIADYWVLGAGARLEVGKSAALLLDCEELLGHDMREQFISLSGQISF